MSAGTSSVLPAGDSYPKLVAFDLDYTLWDLWIDTHVTGPLRREGQRLNEVLDKHGDVIAFYEDVPQILHSIRAQTLRPDGKDEDDDGDEKVVIAACSRTHAPNLAHRCLELLLVPPSPDQSDLSPTRAIDFFDEKEIYPGSKIKHFTALHERTGIPYSQMLFFDDEHRNSEVQKLGVTFHHCPEGLTQKVFDCGLTKWRSRHAQKP